MSDLFLSVGTETLPIENLSIIDLPRQTGSYYADIVNWVTNNQWELAIAALIAALIYMALSIVPIVAARRLAKIENPNSIAAIIARVISKTGQFFRIMLSIELVTVAANTPPSLMRVITFLFTVAAVFQFAIWARALIIGFVERRAGNDRQNETLRNAVSLIRMLVSFGVFAIALIVVLDNLGVNVTGLIAGLGVGGIAIGLAAQGIFSDLFAAISIIFDKPFRVGDAISYGRSTATVEKIGMRSVRLRSIGGELLIISNAKLLDQEITNNTMTSYRRAQYPIGVVYQTAPDVARQIPDMLKQAVEENGGTFVRAGFTSFGDSAINFDLYFDVFSDSYQEIFETRHAIGVAIIERFGAEGIEFAYPTQTTYTAAPDGSMIMPYPGKPGKS